MTREFQLHVQRLLQEWRTRLLRLRRILAHHPKREWIWTARTRILTYLVSRYKDAAVERESEQDSPYESASVFEQYESDTVYPTVYPATTVGKTPRSFLHIRLPLEDIHRLNSYENGEA